MKSNEEMIETLDGVNLREAVDLSVSGDEPVMTTGFDPRVAVDLSMSDDGPMMTEASYSHTHTGDGIDLRQALDLSASGDEPVMTTGFDPRVAVDLSLSDDGPVMTETSYSHTHTGDGVDLRAAIDMSASGDGMAMAAVGLFSSTAPSATTTAVGRGVEQGIPISELGTLNPSDLRNMTLDDDMAYFEGPGLGGSNTK